MHVISVLYPSANVLMWDTDMGDRSKPDVSVLHDDNISQKHSEAVAQTERQSVNVQEGDWCFVLYDGIKYAGEVITVNQTEVEVTVMIPTGKYWKWPEKVDKIFYPKNSIIEKLSPPIVVNSRGPQFSFALATKT